MLKAEEILKTLPGFIGTMEYYPTAFKKMKLTDGIQWLCESAESFWLVDLVESYFLTDPKIRNNPFLIWRIVVKDKSAVVDAREDTNEKPLISQEIPYTDFPLDQFEFYQEGNVILLKSEH